MFVSFLEHALLARLHLRRSLSSLMRHELAFHQYIRIPDIFLTAGNEESVHNASGKWSQDVFRFTDLHGSKVFML